VIQGGVEWIGDSRVIQGRVSRKHWQKQATVELKLIDVWN